MARPYEIATIGDARSRGPVAPSRLGLLEPLELRELVTTPALVGAGLGVVVGLVLGAVLFSGVAPRERR